MFSALSFNHSDIRDKISVFIALSPVMFLDHTEYLAMQTLLKELDSITWWLDALNIHEFFSPDWYVAQNTFCSFKFDFCKSLNEMTQNRRYWGFDSFEVPIEDQKLQNPASVKQFVHFA